MLGAIIGDIVGSRFEFSPTNRRDFALFGKGCSFTDDSICTIAVADAILRGMASHGGACGDGVVAIAYREALLDWCRRYPYPMGGYGGSFARWLRAEDPHPYGSYGNGSAMRVSAVGWLLGTEEEVAEQAKLSAACTHDHPQGIAGAQATALAIYWARQGGAKEEVVRRAAAWGGYDLDFSWDSVRNRFDVTCQGTVPVALKCVAETESYEEAVRLAVSLGADADTLAAIAGSIAEALYGVPEALVEGVMPYLTPEIMAVWEAFRKRVG